SKTNVEGVDNWTKERDGKKVTLGDVDATIGEEEPLVFVTHEERPDRLVGALGIVVMVDENVSQYIHIHPATDDITTCNERLSKPGMNKISDEFKFDENVHVYRFVIDVKK